MSVQSKFKVSEIGRIPKEWEVKKITDVFSLKTGTTPSTKVKEYWDGGNIIWITPADMSGLRDRLYISTSQRRITDRALKNTNLPVMPVRSIVISTRAPVGYVAVTKEKVTFNQGCKGLVPKDEEVTSTEFCAYYLLSKSTMLQTLSGGSTFKELSKNRLANLDVPLPPLAEQEKIAEVLSTVDDAIQKVDHAIEKTQRLKKGLMQKLLTRGIGHSEFKETEIGRIPKKWAVVRLGDESIARIRGNRTINGFEKVAFIPMESVPNSSILVEYEVMPRKDVRSFTYCKRGDLLLAKITPSLENGKQGIVPDKVPNGFALATTEVFPISCTGIEKLFLFYLLKFPKFRNRIISSMTGTTGRQRASKKSVENLEIPLPPVPEQRKIAEILGTVDERIRHLRGRKETLQRVKKGLMQDLLTGRKRVKV